MLTLSPISFKEANFYVSQYHRHHRPTVGMKFALAVCKDEKVVGVAIVGRPVSRIRDDSFTLEVNRCCTDGTKNACSFLYGAAWRAARALGYKRLITYTHQDESGSSLRGAGWKVIGEVAAQSWSCPSRPRIDVEPLQAKFCWEAQWRRQLAAKIRKSEFPTTN